MKIPLLALIVLLCLASYAGAITYQGVTMTGGVDTVSTAEEDGGEAGDNQLLLETGDVLLLETGDSLLME